MMYMALLVLLSPHFAWSKSLRLVGRVTQQIRISQQDGRPDNTSQFSIQTNSADGMTVEVMEKTQSTSVATRNIASDNPNKVAEMNLPQLKPGVYMVILRQL